LAGYDVNQMPMAALCRFQLRLAARASSGGGPHTVTLTNTTLTSSAAIRY